MIKRDGSTEQFYLVRGTDEERKQLDAALERVSPDVERWWTPEESLKRRQALADQTPAENKIDIRVRYGPKQILGYVRAKASGPATPEVFEARMAQCLVCSKLVVDGEKKFCGGGCGCGKRPEAELTIKLNYAHATCPLFKEGFSNTRRKK